MEKTEFIAKAKNNGMKDSEIRVFLENYARLEAEGKAYPLEDVFDGVLTPDEIDGLYAGPPAQAVPA